MLLYLREFTFPSIEDEELFLNDEVKQTCMKMLSTDDFGGDCK